MSPNQTRTSMFALKTTGKTYPSGKGYAHFEAISLRAIAAKPMPNKGTTLRPSGWQRACFLRSRRQDTQEVSLAEKRKRYVIA